MPGKTKIEWSEKTWNPVTGCEKVSPGCDHCYAETFAERFRGTPGHPYEQGFDLKLWPERLSIPLQWKKPAKIFVNSMSDLFHRDVPDKFIVSVFDTMIVANHHIFQVLTKRPSRLANARDLTDLILRLAVIRTGKREWPRHIWLGTSIESNQYIWRADKLRQVPAPIRFISAEPLLGELSDLNLEGISWLIAGAESGHGARPMDENWVRFLRDKCVSQDVNFFYKQNAVNGRKIPTPELDGQRWVQFPIEMED